LRVSENIGLGNVENLSLETIQQAAKSAEAHDFITKLESQYSTPLGLSSRGGILQWKLKNVFKLNPTELSGGQWQRIALSRAFMRSSADLLVLDEPSSSLDPEAEYNLFQFIKKGRKDKTTIFVTHRFQTVAMANKIAFFDDGVLSEWGSHDELVKIEDGKYAKYFRLQSEGFHSLK
jgi:ATP-binding cassette, subfamily B, bacterial